MACNHKTQKGKKLCAEWGAMCAAVEGSSKESLPVNRSGPETEAALTAIGGRQLRVYTDGGADGVGSHVYVTMLRAPIERLMSWHAWCDRSTRDFCNINARSLDRHEARQETVTEARRHNVSLLTAFYSVREKQMRSVALPTTAARCAAAGF